MLDLTTIFNFSHHYCIAICAVLVPFNLLTTLTTLILTGTNRYQRVWYPAVLAIVGSGLMVFHVLTWFMVGVVRLETFVLLLLAVCCLSLNLWSLWHFSSLRQTIRLLLLAVWDFWRSLSQSVEVS